MGDKFHRLLWIVLVAVAFTFTVILTSVFVDIDDLLARRNSPVKQQVVTEAIETEDSVAFGDDIQSFPSNEENSDENESTFRTKRSLDSRNYLLHIKSPKVKKILTNRLATLLEELDEEESSKGTNSVGIVVDLKDKNVINQKYPSAEETTQNIKKIILNDKDINYEKGKKIDHGDVLHLAMHNILLQGIVGHMDLNDVYKRVQLLMKSFDTTADSDAKDIYAPENKQIDTPETLKFIPQNTYQEVAKFFNELLKCKKLQKEISQRQDIEVADKKEIANDSHMLIKTIIEITNNNGKENIRNSNENTTDAVKFIYNGKEIKSVEINDDKNVENEANDNGHIKQDRQTINESDLRRAIEEYLKMHSLNFYNKHNLMAKHSYVTKRLKRQIKIHYLDNRVTTEKSKRLKEKRKSSDDELYVEIETHFDGKGIKGEKKKKLVRTLIDKIQKAINSNTELLTGDKTIKKQHLQIKKRMQNPIDHNDSITSTTSQIDIIEHRELNPISKTANVVQPLTSVLDRAGDTWKKIYRGPGFLTASKSLNSAEMRELDIDYNSVMKNGIPKRLQKPINTESEDLTKPNEDTNNGNVTLFLKDINGSGFSVGINQYADDPPDEDTLKVFTGIENLIQTYHEQYDQTETISNESNDQANYVKMNHDIKRRDVNKVKKTKAPQFANEKIMYKGKEKNNLMSYTRRNRQKRSAINVKLFSNIKSKTKLNKFINTHAMPRKKIFLKGKRNKRQIDKIRIIATDRYPSPLRENIYLDSRENIHANRAVVKEEEIPEVEVGDRNEERYDFISPYSYNMDILNEKPTYLTRNYDTKSVQTGLMSKYPHIILENISRSKEFINVSPGNTIEEKSYKKVNTKTAIHTVNDDQSDEKNISSTNVDDIVKAILPSPNNFKVVVKIFPNNDTNFGPGYKEVHTSINKSFDKNGVRYVSSLNVSEISKFENLNKSKQKEVPTANNNAMELGQNRIKLLLELHKEGIDRQLDNLKMESNKLKQMIGHESFNKNFSQLVDEFRQMFLKPSSEKIYSRLIINPTTKRSTILSSVTTTRPSYTAINGVEDSEKMSILSSIKNNENITREILNRIDKNTNIMQLFLKKISDRIQSTSQTDLHSQKILNNDGPTHMINDKVIKPLLKQLYSNFTNTMPFIYAFQQPLLTENKNKQFKTMANVVYHGHLHAQKTGNDIGNKDFVKSVANNLNTENDGKINDNRGTNDNETRFFIDELENEYKVASNVLNPVFTPIKTNNTGI